MKTSIKYKIYPVILVGILLLSSSFFYILMKKTDDDMQNFALREIQTAKKNFDDLESQEIRMLKLGILDISTNEDLKQTFIAKDRELLFEKTRVLFQTHKDVIGLTHWLYHEPDGTIFLRVHDKDLFGKPSKERVTWRKSEQSKSWGTGLELGERGYALRAVGPYYNGNELIGYLEYGETIEPFLEIMKKQTGNNFVMLGKKDFLNEKNWKSSMEGAGLRNNYNDHPSYVVLQATDAKFESYSDCFDAEKLDSVQDNGNLFGELDMAGRKYVCGGFSLFDASDKKVGAIVVIKDITVEEAAATQTKYLIVMVTIVATLLILLSLGYVINKVVTEPLSKLTTAGNAIGAGKIETELPQTKSNDEIKEITDTMNTMVEAIRFYKSKQK